MRQRIGSALVQIMACRHEIFNWTLENKISENLIKIGNFSFTEMHMKVSSPKWPPFVQGEMSSFTILNYEIRMSTTLQYRVELRYVKLFIYVTF